MSPNAAGHSDQVRCRWIRAAGWVGAGFVLVAIGLTLHSSRHGPHVVFGRWTRDYAQVLELTSALGIFGIGGLLAPRGIWGRAAGAALRLGVEVAAIGTFTFLLIEGVCRLTERQLSRYIGGPTLTRQYEALVHLNRRGLRDPERPLAKPPGEWRMLALGDSFTFGNGVPDDSTVARTLERALTRRRGPPVEVINAGRPGYNTIQERALLDTLGLRFQPDLVLLQYVLNDPEYSSAGYPRLVPRWMAPLFRSSVAYAALSAAAYYVEVALHWRPDWYEHVHRIFDERSAGWRRHVEALQGIVSDSRAAGVPVAIVVWPLAIPVRDLTNDAFGRERQQALRAARATGVPVLDLMPIFARDRYGDFALSDWDPHPNSDSYRRASAAILAFLDSADLVPPDAGAGVADTRGTADARRPSHR